MRGQPGFFDIDERLRRLSDLGDQLLAFASVVDFEIFRPKLDGSINAPLNVDLAREAGALGGGGGFRDGFERG